MQTSQQNDQQKFTENKQAFSAIAGFTNVIGM